MLQRIQSIWLLFASACVFLTLKYSTYSGTNKNLVPSYFLKGTENMLIMLVTLVAGIIALITIFLYSNRKLQIRLSLLAILLEGVLIYLYFREIRLFESGAISITALFHLGTLFFLILAARSISNDEKLIRESNRLR